MILLRSSLSKMAAASFSRWAPRVHTQRLSHAPPREARTRRTRALGLLVTVAVACALLLLGKSREKPLFIALFQRSPTPFLIFIQNFIYLRFSNPSFDRTPFHRLPLIFSAPPVCRQTFDQSTKIVLQYHFEKLRSLDPSQPRLCFCWHTGFPVLYFTRSVSKRKRPPWNCQRWLNRLPVTQLAALQ